LLQQQPHQQQSMFDKKNLTFFKLNTSNHNSVFSLSLWHAFYSQQFAITPSYSSSTTNLSGAQL
jgi:hypothetical protein